VGGLNRGPGVGRGRARGGTDEGRGIHPGEEQQAGHLVLPVQGHLQNMKKMSSKNEKVEERAEREHANNVAR
jgi:hypothetical protein